MQDTQDFFFYGGLNTDDTDRVVPQGDYRSAFYVRSGNAAQAEDGSAVSMTGNLIVPNVSLPAGVNTVVGSATWVEENSILVFVHNDNFDHSIFKYDYQDESFTLVITSDLLNFQLSHKIFDAKVVNGIVYWTDGWFDSYLNDVDGIWQYNPPRMLNLQKAIDGYAVVDEQTFDVIKYPPYVPASTLGYDDESTVKSNKLYGEVYQFIVQWVYENDEESVWSPISALPVPQKQEFISGRNYLEPNLENVLRIEVLTGSELVKAIRVAVRSGNASQFGLLADLDKAVLGIGDDTVYEVVFDGNNALKPIALSEGLRNYDRVPQVAECLEFLPSKQLCYANFVEGYDGVELNISSSRVLHEIRDTTIKTPTVKYYRTAGVGDPLTIISSDLTVAGNVVPYQEGDVCSFTFTNNPSINGGITEVFTYTITEADMLAISALSVSAGITYIITQIGNAWTAYLDSLGYTVVGAATTILGNIAYTITFTGSTIVPFDSISMVSLYPTRPQKSLKKGAMHEFGIQYYDRGQRSGGVLTSETMNVFVPLPSDELQIPASLANTHSPYTVTPRFQLNHQPPEWAAYYQILTRKTTEIFNFQQRTAIALEVDPAKPNLYKISLDTYYKNGYGAKINQTPQKGDIVRMITTSAAFVNTLPAYAQGYTEVEVQEYSAIDGAGGSECVWVTKFDFVALVDETLGFVLEIYTPKKDLIEEPWLEIGQVKRVLNPYTEDRAHEGDAYDIRIVTQAGIGGDTWEVEGNYVGILDIFPYTLTFTPLVGLPLVTTASTATYDPVTNLTTIVTNDTAPLTSYFDLTFNTSQNIAGSLKGIIDLTFGDVYVRPRLTNRFPNNLTAASIWRYYIEDPSVSDYYISNSSDFGRIGIEDTNFKRRQLIASGIHGGAYIDNSNNNNLCSFDFNVLNKFDLDEQFGAINRIIINGYTLKALQPRKETSIYIQRTMAVGADGGQNVSYTERTFGGINPYDSFYGTVHKGSVRVVDGQLFYYDHTNGLFVRSLNNGQQDLSDGKYKFNKFTYDLTQFINNSGTTQVMSGINTFNNEYRFYVINEEDEVLGAVFNYKDDRWKTFIDYYPEWTENLGAESFEFSEGELYVSDEGAELEFFGIVRDFQISPMFNANPNYVKRPTRIGLRINTVPTSVVVRTTEELSYPVMQTTMSNFKVYENGVWAMYLMDELQVVPQIPKISTTALARVNGRELRGYSALHTIRVASESKVILFSVSVGFVASEAVV